MTKGFPIVLSICEGRDNVMGTQSHLFHETWSNAPIFPSSKYLIFSIASKNSNQSSLHVWENDIQYIVVNKSISLLFPTSHSILASVFHYAINIMMMKTKIFHMMEVWHDAYLVCCCCEISTVAICGRTFVGCLWRTFSVWINAW